MTVLIVTESTDVTADLVIDHLNQRGARLHRVDTADFPTALGFTSRIDSGGRWRGTLTDRHRATLLEDIDAVYYRRPGPFRLPPELDGHGRRWADTEARYGFGGVLSTLPGRWVNHPAVNSAAEYKPRQLAAAAGVGLTIPPTLITNQPGEARRFAAEAPNGVVYKPLHTRPFQHRDTGEVWALPTTPITPGQIADSVAGTAHLFQHQVAKDHELRVTVAGSRLFPVRIDAASEPARVDWRTDYNALTYTPTTLPDTVTRQLLDLTHTLGLRFAAIDMAVTPTGQHVFFEVNPNGQWAWIETATGLPIAAAIADLLEPK